MAEMNAQIKAMLLRCETLQTITPDKLIEIHESEDLTAAQFNCVEQEILRRLQDL